MTLPTTQPINGTEDDSDMFGPPRSSPPIGYHHHRSKVPMISPKLRQREERKRILQLCAHKLERIKDSEANLRRSVCINNTYSRLTDELRREKQSRYLANLPKSEIKPEAAHNNTYSAYTNNSSSNTNNNNNSINNCNINNNNCNNSNNNSNLQHQNDPMEMYPSSTIQNYHNLHYQQQHSHQSSISNQSSTTTCITTSVHSTAKPTIPSISINSNSNNTNTNNNNNLSHSNNNNNNSTSVTSSECQFYSNNNNNNNNTISSAITSTLSSGSSKDCALISSYSKTSTISTPTTSFTCHGSTTTTITRDNSTTSISTSSSSSMITPTTNIGGISLSTSTTNQRNNNNNNNNKFNSTSSSCHHHHISTNSVDADLEILDRELSAIDATMPLTDPEITQGAEHLEKAVSSRKRLRSDCDDNDRFVRDTLYYLQNQSTTTSTSGGQHHHHHHHHHHQQQQQHHHQHHHQKLIDDCPLDLKRPKLSITTQSLSSGLSGSSSSLSPLFGINSFGFNYGIGLGFGLSNNFISNSYTIGCCSQMAMASSLMSAAASVSSAQTILSNNCNLNNNNLITNDLDLELALDLNPPNQKEFEVIMDALRLGTPSPTPSCGSDSCGQAAMMSETGSCNPGGIFNNLVVTSLET